MKNITQTLKIVTLAVVLSLGLNFASAWVAPTLPPPAGNAAEPITTGPFEQIKSGGIILGGKLTIPYLFLGNGGDVGQVLTYSAPSQANNYSNVAWQVPAAGGGPPVAHGKKLFTLSSLFAPSANFTFVVPPGVVKMWVSMSGGGGSGPHGLLNSGKSGGGGGGAHAILAKEIDVVGGMQLQITVGRGGPNNVVFPLSNGSSSSIVSSSFTIVTEGGSGGSGPFTGGGGIDFPGAPLGSSPAGTTDGGMAGEYGVVGRGGDGGGGIFGVGGSGGSVLSGGGSGFTTFARHGGGFGAGGGGGASSSSGPSSGGRGSPGFVLLEW